MFRGAALVRAQPLPIAEILQTPQPLAPEELKGLGDRPQAMRLRLDNGAVVTLAAADAGPAALPDRLPTPTPSERPSSTADLHASTDRRGDQDAVTGR